MLGTALLSQSVGQGRPFLKEATHGGNRIIGHGLDEDSTPTRMGNEDVVPGMQPDGLAELRGDDDLALG